MSLNNSDSNIESIRTSDLGITKNDMKCAPSMTFSNGSCISLDMLVKMAIAYNKFNAKHNKNDRIILNDTMQIMKPDKYKKKLITQFKDKIKSCSDQKCWVEQDFMKYMDVKLKNKALKDTFRPYGPTADQASVWLNTTNIDEVMTQYEDIYKDFKYLATVPIDFNELDYYPLKGINFNDYVKKGKMKLGVVFNLDTSKQSGSHWTGLLINFDSGQILYSDSYGVPADKRINDFMQKAGKFIKDELGMKPLIKVSRKRHQYGGSQCGMFSMFFILSLLEGKTFEEINSKRIPDEFVNKYRIEFFIKKNSGGGRKH